MSDAGDSLLSKSKERFSWSLFLIVVSVHFLALGGLYFWSLNAVGWWLFAHVLFSTFGVSLGLHRFFSHRTFQAREPLSSLIALVSTLCFQGGPIFWASTHRMHHRFTEKFGDAHSAERGFLWSHVVWMFYRNPNGFSYAKSMSLVRDLRQVRVFFFLEKYSTQVNFGFLAGLAAICFAFGRADLFFWLGPVRIVSVWHATWLINSFAHSAPLRGGSRPTQLINSPLMSLILGGEGDHEFHHQHPSSVKHSRYRIGLDYGYQILRLFRVFGLVKYREPLSYKVDVHSALPVHELVTHSYGPIEERKTS